MSFAAEFRDELTKIASTAMTRYLAGDPTGGRTTRLGPRLQEAMNSGRIRSREATIKSLGRGGTQQADLVMSPEFGAAVRKYRPDSAYDPRNQPLQQHLGEHAYRHFAGYFGAKHPDASVPEALRQPVHYWEPVFGEAAHIGKRTQAQHRALTQRLSARAGNASAPNADAMLARNRSWAKRLHPNDAAAARETYYGRMRRAGDAHQAAYRRFDASVATPEIAADAAAIQRRMGRKIDDWQTARNIVGGRVVDADVRPERFSATFGRSEQEAKAARQAVYRTVNHPAAVEVSPIGVAHGAVAPAVRADVPTPSAPPTTAGRPPAGAKPTLKPTSAMPWGRVAAGVGAAAALYGGYRWWRARQQRERKQRTKAGLPR